MMIILAYKEDKEAEEKKEGFRSPGPTKKHGKRLKG